jgi:hypothetical protein
MRDEMIPVKKHQIWFLTKGRGIERELLVKQLFAMKIK